MNIIWDESSAEAVAKLRAMNEAGNITWDLVDVTVSDAIRLCDEGLAEEIDFDTESCCAPDGTSATDDFGATEVGTTASSRRSSIRPPSAIAPTLLATRRRPRSATSSTSRSIPASVRSRSARSTTWNGRSTATAFRRKTSTTCSGPTRASSARLNKLDTIKDQVVWWTAGAETPQLLADGEVVMGSTYNGRLFSAIAEQNQPIAMLWDVQILRHRRLDRPGRPSGREGSRVMDFLKFATDTQRLADQAKYISYGPARASSAPLVGKHATLGIDMAPHMPTDPANATNAHVYDYTWWADHRDESGRQVPGVAGAIVTAEGRGRHGPFHLISFVTLTFRIRTGER